jgi:uncharacterized protein YecE (DUF72 family)
MDFGKLNNLENVDFTLPPDNVNNSLVLTGKSTNKPSVHLGFPIWSDKAWIGKIYPDDAQEKYFLRYYAQQFNSIELNATHYKIPSPTTIQRWKNMTTNNFKFCPKVPQVISHAKDITEMSALMTEFIDAVIYFDNALGTTFMQLPQHFGANRLNELITFLGLIEKPIKLAVELRHESWFTNKQAFDELSEFLMECNHSLVITDVAGRRDVLHQRLTNKTAFIRFGANDLHTSDYTRLTEWAERCSQWIEQGLEELYFFIHTSDQSVAPEIANHFIHEFNKLNRVKLKPVSIKQESKQIDLFA